MSESLDENWEAETAPENSPSDTPTASQDSDDAAQTSNVAIPLAKAGLVTALAVATAACGGGGSDSGAAAGGGATGGGGGDTPAPTDRRPETDAEAARFLLHASISASPGEIAAVRGRGYEPWLDQQMNARNAQSAQDFIAEQGFDDVTSRDFLFNRGVADTMIWSQLLSGANPVRARGFGSV